MIATAAVLLASSVLAHPTPSLELASQELTVEAEFVDGSAEQLALSEIPGLASGEGLEPVLLRIQGARDVARRGTDRATLDLLDGDRLTGRIGGGEGEELFLELPGAALLTLPIDAFTRLVFDGRIPEDPGMPVAAPAEGDRLYRRVGDRLDRVDGAIEGFTAEGVRFDGLIGARTYPWEELAALFVEPLVEPEPWVPAADAVTLDLVDGSRLRGALLEVDAEAIRVAARPAGQPLLLPWSAVRLVSAHDGRLEWLSAIAPTRAIDAAPFGDALGMVWPHRVDRAVQGDLLRAGGRVWSRGVGVHGPSRLEWELDGSAGVLRGACAVDDSTQRLAARGSVVFVVEVDGDVAFRSTVVRGGDTPVSIPAIDLEGASRLALSVEVADAAHVADRANWLELRVVR
ncbi:MAG: NPCBM/NEW2 domain-containing protein [Planctomycetota bacterium]|jgi:hypothetical protein